MAQVKYSEALVQRAVRQQVRKMLAPTYGIVIATLFGTGIFATLSGSPVWFAYVAGFFFLQACFLPLVTMQLRSKFSFAGLVALKGECVAIDMTAGRFRANSALASIDLPLNRITTVVCSPDYWLLKSGRRTMMLLPTLDVPWPTVDGWLNELRQAGATVV